MNIFRHISRRFLPSKTLANYMMRLYLGRFFGILVGLTAVLQLLDLMSVSDEVLAASGASYGSLISYVALRFPQLISQFAPFVALLATLLSLASLNQHSEIIVMKAIGLSAHRILLPLGIACAIVAFIHFIFNETIVVESSAQLSYWQSQDYAVDLPPRTDKTERVWLTEGKTVVLVDSVTQSGNRVILDKVNFFERDSDGKLIAIVKADFAWHQNGKWTLFEVKRFNTQNHTVTVQPSITWNLLTPPERFLALTVNPKHVNIITLWKSIQQLDKEGLPTDTLMTNFLHKLIGPMAAMLMPILGAIAAFGVSRGGTIFVRLVLGMSLGFAFFIADNFMLAMGQFGVASPFLASATPFILFLSIGYAVIFHTEEGGKALGRD